MSTLILSKANARVHTTFLLATVVFWSAPSAPRKNTVILPVRRFSNSSGKGDGHDEAHSVRAPGFSVGRKRGL